MEDLITLHRYYIWANRLRENFDSTLTSLGNKLSPDNIPLAFADDLGLFNSYWYAALYVVVEGWRDLGFHDEEIDGLLESPNLDLLRRYRHGVCHFQREYFDRRFVELIEAPDSVEWVRRLHSALGRYLMNELLARRARRAAI